MRGWSWTVRSAVLTALLVAAPCPAEEFLVGRGERQWLILSEPGYYRLVRRSKKGQWRKLPGEHAGEVAAATAIRAGAMVFLADGVSIRYGDPGESQRGLRPPAALWPAGTKLLSICPADGDDSGAVALIRRPTRLAARTQPVTAPAEGDDAPGPAPANAVVFERGQEVALLRYLGQEWTELAVAPAELVGRPETAFVAALDGKVCVLADRPKRKLLELSDTRWRQLTLPAGLRGGRVVAFFAAGKELVLAVFNARGDRQVRVARFVSGRWVGDDPLHVAGTKDRPQPRSVTWSEASPPLVAPSDQGVGAAWREDGRWTYARFSRSGVRERPPKDVLRKAEAAEAASRFKERFLLGVLLVLGLLLFWPGQTPRTEPFSLPDGMQPARLSRRLAAALIDLMPFSLAAYLLLGAPDPKAFSTALREGTVRARDIYATLGSLVAFAAYCTVMEHVFGATLGKMALRLRVVGDGGGKPGIREIALRNLTKIPEIVPPFIAVTWLFPLLSRYRQRLGDKIAWTAVIDASSVPAPPEPTPEPDQREHEDRQEEP